MLYKNELTTRDLSAIILQREKRRGERYAWIEERKGEALSARGGVGERGGGGDPALAGDFG
jgi:hypothetical protein